MVIEIHFNVVPWVAVSDCDSHEVVRAIAAKRGIVLK